jgi:hypothetical protein
MEPADPVAAAVARAFRDERAIVLAGDSGAWR